MQIHCRCGQAYTVYDRFPYKVRCHACGRHFGVLDDGKTIDFGDLDSAETDSHSLESTALQATPTLSPARLAFYTEPTQATEPPANLKLIDSQWDAEQYRLCIASVFGFYVMPSLVVLFAIFLIGLAVGVACIYGAFLLVIARGDSAELAAILAACGVIVPLMTLGYVRGKCRDLKLYRDAELDWRRKREQALQGQTTFVS